MPRNILLMLVALFVALAIPAAPAAATPTDRLAAALAAAVSPPADLSRAAICVGRCRGQEHRLLFAGWTEAEVAAYRDFLAAMVMDGAVTLSGINNIWSQHGSWLPLIGIHNRWQLEGNPVVRALLEMGGAHAMTAGGAMSALAVYHMANALRPPRRVWWLRFVAAIHLRAGASWWWTSPSGPGTTLTLLSARW
jgi:hypothetical protein